MPINARSTPFIARFVSIITYSLLIIAGAATLHATARGAQFSVDQVPGRLPKNIIPIRYSLAFTPNVAALTLQGRESVVLEVRTATDSIRFNSLNEVLRGVRLDGMPVKGVVSDDAAQMTTVTLRVPATVGMHTLSFAYSAKIETQPRGLFLQHYVAPDGKSGSLLSTQMEATDARRLFPCWDEPAFRAVFDVTATVPANWKTIGNMPIARRVVHGPLATTTFQSSPKMPSYLVEFTAGELGSISGASDGIKLGIWAIRGSENQGDTALENARTILSDYDAYFGYKFPLPKLDSIAVPGGFEGAMENWGAITYNDQVLLLSPSSSIKNRQDVFSVQAHEMAHQWNGDLVTMAWWDDIWLNESFASWMAAKETALRNPTWKWWENQDADKEAAMGADAFTMSHAIQQHVTDEQQATSAFDPAITYSKGQAILRMFEGYLGPDVFRAGVRGYMREFAFSNTSTGDLWHALNLASGKDISAFAGSWTGQAGFPLVTVVAACAADGARTLRLSQQRFLLRGTDSVHSRWKIPLQVRDSRDAPPRAVLLEQDSQSIPGGRCDAPLSVNAGALGFYRTRYDESTLAVNTRHFGQLPDADRITLLDDQWALVQSGAQPLPTYLALAGSMGTDMDARAWTQIAAALGTIEDSQRGSPGHDAFAAYARSLLRPAFDRLGWDAGPDDTPDVKTLRQTFILELGSWGDPGIIDEARRRFAAFVNDGNSIAPDAQEAILSIVAENADQATFDSLHALARSAMDETRIRRYYRALMNVTDPMLAQQAAAIALSKDIPAQADSLRLSLLMRLADRHPPLSWQVLRDHSEFVLKPYSMNAPLMLAQYVPAAYWKIPAAELESWIRAHTTAETAANVDRGIEAARFRVSAKDLLVPASDAYLRR